MKRILKIFTVGGCGYYIIEGLYRTILNRGSVHWTMFLVGGLSLVSIVTIDNLLKYSIIIKSILSAIVITLMEFIVGYIYTYIIHKPIWTYGTADFMGIISFTWSLLWCGMACLVLIIKHLLHKITKQND